jgi:hypothetical protein
MNHACESIIQLDQQIKFVCIVDKDAKLLAGQSRSILTNPSALNTSETNEHSPNSNESKVDDPVEIHLKHRNMYLFYSEYLSWIIRSCTGNLDDTRDKDCLSTTHITNKFETTFFELSGFDSDDVKLVVTPLDVITRTFLCIYFEPPYSIKSSVAAANRRFKVLLQRIQVLIA